MKDLTCSIFSFEKLRQGNYLYVDKTEYIWKLINLPGESYFFSRPRRFGKSLTISTLKAVFEGKKELFKGLAIYDKPYDWKTYPVIHLDLSDCETENITIDKLNLLLLEKIKIIANCHSITLPVFDDSTTALGYLIDTLAHKMPVVVLCDEYDKPISDNLLAPNIKEIKNFLFDFYGVLKEKNPQEHFVFVTGVEKMAHDSLVAGFNNLTDITMDSRFATMCGYTQEELETNFSDRIAALAGDRDLTDFKHEIKEWYNGFRFEENARTVYNPVSLAKFFESGGKFSNYWFSTGTPTFLLELAKSRNFNFEKSIKEPVPEITFSAFEVDDIDPLALLLQTGYMTIKSTEQRFGQTWYYLDFPNREVSGAFSAYILNSYAHKTQTGVVTFTADIATALLKGELEKLHKLMEVFFAGIPYTVHKKNEATLQAIFFSLFRLLGEFIEAESCTNDGRIDAVVQTPQAIYLFEFKLDNDPTALEQIQKKEYFQKYLCDKRTIHLIGVNFDADKGNLIGWKTGKISGSL